MRTAKEMYDVSVSAMQTQINLDIENAAGEGKTSIDVDNMDTKMGDIIFSKLKNAGYTVNPSGLRNNKTTISWKNV